MDTRKLSKPIVMAKPIRGREMQSTVIPKDVVETVKAVSAKQMRGDSIVESLQKPREGDMEVYHEGYVDGKLYLVPDSNLQAMRDIVNLKMRRRHSSAEKPQTSLDEPTQYAEFKSKLDCLLEKIDELALSSCDETESLAGSTYSKKGLEKKKKKRLRKNFKKKTTPDVQSTKSMIKKGSEKKPTKSETSSQKNAEKRVVIPPMLDDNISYIRVRSKDQIKSGKAGREFYSFDLPPEASNEKDINEFEEQVKEQDTEKFNLLVSGHLKNGIVPIFIVHQNYAGLNVLETDPPDFKTHKKEGNIDIFITGKFFTGNILKKESSGSPAVLDIKPNKIVIDKKNDVHRRKFKDIYKVGPLKVALEGEFKKDSKTLKYTPVFSLNIVKSSLDSEKMLQENKSGNVTPTDLFYTGQICNTPFRNDNQIKKGEPSTSKHVHYESGNREPCKDTNSKKGKRAKNKSIITLLKNNMIYNRFFSKTNRKQCDTNLESESSSQQIRASSSKIKREELAKLRKSRLSERRNKRGQTKIVTKNQEEGPPNKTKHDIPSSQLFRCETNPSCELQAGFTSTTKEQEKVSEQNLEAKKVRKVRKKKTDKNQAIVENPILAQMQEFFIA